MRDADELRRKLFGIGKERATVFLGTVSEVQESEFTATVQCGDVSYFDVRLRSVINPDLTGFAFIPKIESHVLCARIHDSNELFIALFSEVEKVIFDNENINILIDPEAVQITIGDTAAELTAESITLNVGDTTAELTADNITLNGGKLGGLVKVEQLEKNLDALKKYVEAINTALPAAFTAIGASTAANGALGQTSYKTSMAGKIIAFESMENDKVKH